MKLNNLKEKNWCKNFDLCWYCNSKGIPYVTLCFHFIYFLLYSFTLVEVKKDKLIINCLYVCMKHKTHCKSNNVCFDSFWCHFLFYHKLLSNFICTCFRGKIILISEIETTQSFFVILFLSHSLSHYFSTSLSVFFSCHLKMHQDI